MSLRARLVAASIAVALIALGGAGIATYTAYAHWQLQQVDDTLQRTHEPIEELVERGGADLERAIEQAAANTYVAVLRPGGVVDLVVPAREPGHAPSVASDVSDVPAPRRTDAGADVPTFATLDSTDGSQLRVRVSRLGDGRALVVGQSLHEAAEARRRLLMIEAVVAAAALFVAGGLAWVLVRAGLRPLDRVEQTAQRIASGGELDHVVPGDGRGDEIGRLARALNTMLGRIREAFAQRDETERALRSSEERMRRFVADVSHELRTPLTAVSAYTELFERGARDRPDDLARAMRGIAVESERMRDLVEELLLLAELDEGRELVSVAVDLSAVVADAVAAALTVAPAWPVVLHVGDVVVVRGDPGRLRQVVDNLLSNVRAHTPAGTQTTISVAADDGQGVLTVADDGPGLTADETAHAFDRFFRADPSRSRTSGGAGLGLAIVHSLVTAHHGTVSLTSAPGAGVTVTVILPLADRSDDVRPVEAQT